MKKYSPSVLKAEVWQEIEYLFRRHDLSCLPFGSSSDGINAITIETTKRGIEITGQIWFLPHSQYKLHLYLNRPHFSNLSSITPARVRSAKIIDSWLDDRTLVVTVGLSESAAIQTNPTEPPRQAEQVAGGNAASAAWGKL